MYKIYLYFISILNLEPGETIKHFCPTLCWMNMSYCLAASLNSAFKCFSVVRFLVKDCLPV